MKKVICLLLIVLTSCLFVLPAFAASEAPVITLQPQSCNYPEYGVAIYTVKAAGTNLTAIWYMEWAGNTYTISDIGGAAQAWEGYAGETYGARKLDDHTFAYIFSGIGSELNGANIWCVIEDGHYDVTSQKARIMVGNPNLPPEITDIPTQLTVEQGAEAEIRCIANSADGSQLSFLWYETDTGRLEDIRAVNRGTETSDYMLCDTSVPGTRNYLCMVETSKGGVAYSSIVTVTVTEPPKLPPEILSIPSELSVEKGKEAQIRCVAKTVDGSQLSFLWYETDTGRLEDIRAVNRGTETLDTLICDTAFVGTRYYVCKVESANGGVVYSRVVAVTVTEPPRPTESPTQPPTQATEPPTQPQTQPPTQPPTQAPTQATEPSTQPPTQAPTKPTQPTTQPPVSSTAPTQPSQSVPQEDAEEGIPGWILILIGAGAAVIGVVFAIILVKKKS